jgi:Fur family transcriptional regulator, peroxide stress response regulator
MSDPNVPSLPDLFASRGLRCTRQRRALYEALRATTAHPTADQLYRDVAPRMKGMSLATVYNTLDAFVEAGLALKLAGARGSARYDATVSNHVHTRCEVCGKVGDVPVDLGETLLTRLPPELVKQIEAALGFEIHEIRVELIGRCTSEEAGPNGKIN